MYIPQHFLIDSQQESERFIKHNGFAQLISVVDGALFATHLPLLHQSEERKLLGHIARANPQWYGLDGQPVLVIFAGPHDYVSPSWYSAPGVPTWNYQAVHVTGVAKSLHDPAQLESIITALTSQYESRFESPWVPSYEASKVRGIVGIEIAIEQIQCKYKLSQNRSESDRRNVASQLRSAGNPALADAMLDALALSSGLDH